MALLDWLTNSLDTARFSWDFRYYIDMAEHGTGAAARQPICVPLLDTAAGADDLARVAGSGGSGLWVSWLVPRL